VTVESGRLAAAEVRSMFDRIARVYDPMNRILTAGLDGRWRRRTAEAVVRAGDRVLDACCGTGDLAIAGLWPEQSPAPSHDTLHEHEVTHPLEPAFAD
jgi:hypothetical protein